jgi:hypothetical protein
MEMCFVLSKDDVLEDISLYVNENTAMTLF